MSSSTSRQRPSIVAALLTFWIATAGTALHSGEAQATPENDERYIVSLMTLDDRDPVDRAGLAGLFHGAASTLDGGKRDLRALQSRIALRTPGREAVVSLAQRYYEEYDTRVVEFKVSTAAFKGSPSSNLLLYRVLVNGHKSCWNLDRYTGMLESHGISAGDLATVLPSGEACSRFRRAAYQPRVTALVEEQLVAQSYGTQEVIELREELAALERLLEDLRQIDNAE